MTASPPSPSSAHWADTPRPGSASAHRRYGGVGWSYDARGVYVDGATSPQRTPGAPVTCGTICNLFAAMLIARSIESGIAPEFIVMIIATETAAFRSSDFTGPPTFYWEPGVIVRDAPPQFRGDYSAGPMQVLASNARALIRKNDSSIDPAIAFPPYRFRPAAPPQAIPGYTPALNIELGVRLMQQNIPRSKGDPILTAAIYNAGGIHDASRSRKYANRWHLRSTGNYLDRAAKWYGDACAVIAALRSNG